MSKVTDQVDGAQASTLARSVFLLGEGDVASLDQDAPLTSLRPHAPSLHLVAKALGDAQLHYRGHEIFLAGIESGRLQSLLRLLEEYPIGDLAGVRRERLLRDAQQLIDGEASLPEIDDFDAWDALAGRLDGLLEAPDTSDKAGAAQHSDGDDALGDATQGAAERNDEASLATGHTLAISDDGECAAWVDGGGAFAIVSGGAPVILASANASSLARDLVAWVDLGIAPHLSVSLQVAP